jgi:hypothetical protein
MANLMWKRQGTIIPGKLIMGGYANIVGRVPLILIRCHVSEYCEIE